jgi:predicted dehydrogenase
MPEPRSPLRWGILGTGAIAHKFAKDLADSRTGKLAAVGARAQDSASRFAREFGAPRAHGSYEALLEDPAVDAVYLSTIHPEHHRWAIAAAGCGKHILCEKPLTLCRHEADAVVRKAREKKVFLMEAFMYRCHPQTAKLLELIRGGAIGRIGLIESSFGGHAPFDPKSRLFDKSLGGGGILDIGCYPVSVARLIAGVAEGKPFADPVKLTGHGVLHPETGVDLYAAATAEFPGGILAQLSTAIGLQLGNGLHIYGSEGSLHVPAPFAIPRHGAHLELRPHGKTKPEIISIPHTRPIYALEADAVGDAILAGQLESPAMPLDDTLGNMTALDAWRAAIGLRYACDERMP